ncbi:hypothetical protein [Streptomyces sp. uw30]|uniref:hypothetical protein n=1 Tax=Streptomyces sp. uw30 TaxID=1828179 RepID=UPI0011CDE8A9|nr:hypothetical protein [Streptomyces sp. uw30]
MDSTDSARRVLGGDGAPVSYVVPVTGVRSQPSIYAALVAEWRAKGRTVPGRRDTLWDLLVAADDQGRAITSWAVGRCAGLTPAVATEPADERRAHTEERPAQEDEGLAQGDEQPTHAAERVPAIVVPRGLPGPLFVWEGSGSGGRVGVADPLTAD